MVDSATRDQRDDVRQRVVELVGRLLAEAWIRDQSDHTPKEHQSEVGCPDPPAAR